MGNLCGWRVQEDRRVFRLDDCPEVVNVLLNPWQVSRVSVNAILIFGKAVPLQRVGKSDVGIRNHHLVWDTEVAR